MNRQGIGLWIVVIALLVLDIGVHCVRAQDDSSKVVKTQDLQILDSSGNEVTDLTSDPKTGGASITLYDSKGNGRLGLYSDNNGGVLQLYNAAGDTIAALDGSDAPSLAFYKDKQDKADIGVSPDGASSVTLSDDAGNGRAGMFYDQKNDTAHILVSDKTGKSAAMMGEDSTGAYVYATDPDGNNRVGFQVTSEGTPEVYVAGKDGKYVWAQTDQGNTADNNSNSNSGPGSSGDSDSGTHLRAPRNRNSN